MSPSWDTACNLRPVPTADQQHVEIEKDSRHEQEVQQTRKTNNATGKFEEMTHHAERLQQSP